ncbi:SMP-30/gluconolactonase/LRE family protein [Tenacibaculum agarivorans]|uniref:SMP-30/gluconolactonase/LRE family protein n=1 Tax=Tenacibaculum agarivorans TaxID=1908389 RepID=UPI00094BAB58|nr:L-dopachrome tautomerase-related protein [Tenacibaculum agarivorans]
MRKYSVVILLSFTFMSCSAQKDNGIFMTTNHAVGNITFTTKGNLVYSHHPFFEPENRVMLYDKESKTHRPFPNKVWNTPRTTDDHYLSNVLGIRNDIHGNIWMLDMGMRNNITPKIVGWNMKNNSLERIYYLPETTVVKTSQPNDMVVDSKHGVFIIADEGIGNGGDGSTAAFIIVDMKTGKTRRVLEGSRTTLSDTSSPTRVNGKVLSINKKALFVGNDGITADASFEWLYYGPLNGPHIYRVKIEDLLDTSLSEKQLDKKIETYANKPNNGGMSIDKDNNLYLTALESNSVVVIKAKDRSMHTIIKDKNLEWPDGVSYNQEDGYMYVSAAQVHLGSVFNKGKDLASSPFYVFRFKPIAEGVPFR